MAGLGAGQPVPTEITLHQQARELELAFDDGLRAVLSCEFLRVFSPSAEVRGHGAGQGVLQTGKRAVAISAIEPVGHYAVKLVFSDGHDSGIYSWDWLYHLAVERDALWSDYLNQLAAAGASRDVDSSSPQAPPACPSQRAKPA